MLLLQKELLRLSTADCFVTQKGFIKNENGEVFKNHLYMYIHTAYKIKLFLFIKWLWISYLEDSVGEAHFHFCYTPTMLSNNLINFLKNRTKSAKFSTFLFFLWNHEVLQEVSFSSKTGCTCESRDLNQIALQLCLQKQYFFLIILHHYSVNDA